MATVQEPTRSFGKYERFVQQEITRAVRRVQFLDVARAALGLAIAVMVYGLAMILADKWLNLPQLARQGGLFAFAAFAIAYTWFVLLRPIRRAINPYYAAIQVEQTIPDAKNSLVNWLDLHEENLPTSVANALGQRAADDLKDTDLQEAIRSNSLIWLAGITLGLVLGFLAAFIIMRSDQFNSLFGRVFSPFSHRAIVKQTRITMLTPADGDATIAISRSLTISVQVDGRMPSAGKPDALKLQIRYNPEDSNWDDFPLEQDKDRAAVWAVRLAPDKVRNGFWYRVTGGDDATPDYRIAVRSSPMIQRFEVTRVYRPYLRFDSRHTFDPNIEDFVGTQITLDAFTNRTVREGKLTMDGGAEKASFAAERLLERPELLRFKFTLKANAKYRIWFTTTDDETNSDPSPYEIRVLQDMKPEVEFTKPEQLTKPEPESDLPIAADGMLRLEGVARDDFGIRRLTLQMKLVEKGPTDRVTPLKPQDYMTERDYRLDTGGYMRTVNYKGDVDLSKLQSASGIHLTPETGQQLEYWLEAEDNCDLYGKTGQIGSTRHYIVKILSPRVGKNLPEEEKQNKQEERAKERESAQHDKAQHDKDHEQNRQKQSDEDRKQQEKRKKEQDQQEKAEREKQEKQNKANSEKNKQDQGNGDKKPEDKNSQGEKGDADKKPEDKTNQGEKGDADKKPQDGNKGDDNPEQLSPDKRDSADKVAKELAKEQNQKNPPENSGNETPKGKPKPAEPDKPDANPGAQQGKPEAEPKDPPKDNNGGMGADMNPPAEPKPSDKMQDGGNSAGENKDNKQSPEKRPQHGEDKKAGDASTDPNGMGDAKKPPQEGGGQGNSEPKAPPKPSDAKPKDGMGDGPEKDPKAKPDEPGSAKGNPQDQKPDPNKAGNPMDQANKPKDHQPGDGGMGEPKPDNSAKEGAAKKSPPQSQDGSGAEQPNDPQKPDDQAGAAKPKDGQSSPKAQPKPDQNAKNDGGKPNGEQKPAGKGDPKDAAKADPKPAQDKDNPMGKGEVAKSDPKPDKGAADPKDAQPKEGAGGKDDVAKAAEQMKNGDAKQKADAKQKLGEMAKDNSDPQKQKAAQDALKKAEKGEKGNEGVAKDAPKDPKPGDPNSEKPQVAEKKDAPKDAAGKPGEQKPAEKGDPQVAKNSQPKDSAQAKQAQQTAEKKSQPKDKDANAVCNNKACDNPGNTGQPKPGGGNGQANQTAKAEPKSSPKDSKGSGSTGTGGTGENNPMVAKNDPAKPADPMKPGDPMKSNEPMVAKNDPMKPSDPMSGADGQKGEQSPATAKANPGEPGEGKPMDEKPGEGGGNPGNGNNATRQTPGQASPEQRAKIDAANEEFKNRGGVMNLDKVDKEKLKKLFEKYKLTDEEWQRYLAEQRKLKNNPPATPDKKDLQAGNRTESNGGHLNTGVKRVEGSVDPNAGQLSSGNTGQAPPEYKQAAEKFAELLAKPPAAKKK